MNYISYFLSEDDNYQLELKSTTKAALAGGGIGLAVPVPAGAAIGAVTGYKYKQEKIKERCRELYKTGSDRSNCYRFRNSTGSYPRSKKDLERGQRMN